MDYSEVYGYSSPSRGRNRFLWMFFFGVIFIGVLIGIYFLLGANKTISENKLVQGTSLELGANDSVKIKTGEGDEHNFEVNFVGLDYVDITIRSDPIEINGLRINEIREIDLDGDGVLDLRVKLVSINDGKAVIAVTKIKKEICEEDWVCGDWSSCVLESQGRDCTDLNNCGTIINRPDLSRSCGTENENNEEDNGSVINTNNQNNSSSLGTYISQLKSKDCSAYVAPNCGIVYDNNIPKYNKTWSDSTGNSTLTIPVYDDSCAAVCFGNAFRNNCQVASLNMVNNKGSQEKLEILGKDSNGNCNVKLSFEDVSTSDTQSLDYDGKYLTCPLSIGVSDLKDYSCPLDSCLEENMPGQTSLGVFSSIGFALAFGVAEENGCVGSALDVISCTEGWSCGGWNDCVSGTQNRTCTDLNNCGTSLNKPSLSQKCVDVISCTNENMVSVIEEDFETNSYWEGYENISFKESGTFNENPYTVSYTYCAKYEGVNAQLSIGFQPEIDCEIHTRSRYASEYLNC